MALGQDTIAQNQANKHTTANDAIEQVARKIYDHLEVGVDDTNVVTLTTEQIRRHGIIVLINAGSPPDAAITVNLPATEIGGFILRNATSFTVTVQKVSGQSVTAPTVDAGKIQQLAMDGANVRAIGSASGGGGGGGTALGDLSDVDLASEAPATGDVLTYDGTDWVPSPPAAGAPTVHDRGTITTGTETPEWADGEMQKAVNDGAHTWAAPTNTGCFTLTYTNGSGAGIITVSGFDVVTEVVAGAVAEAGDVLEHVVEGSIIRGAVYNDGVSKELIIALIEDAT